ncbi:hypothetical protein [Roseovarius sp. MMSF_3281]|uniref:DUF6941 family protein n=1 Tax=Roseovarius sp. MMSF_3281 TaxID=3046694 RepID=UPI00273FD1EF|nr:hypothetical protein [Roseovarius sp. MMSF_3281]
MNTEPYGITTFCDDIRHEINGKLTLVGCYASSLNFNGPPPGILPTFAALINLRVPTNIQFEKISLRVIKTEGDEETTILEAEIENSEDHNEPSPASVAGSKEDGKVLLMAFPCQWTPMNFSKPGQIKVRAYLDDDREVRLGALSVMFTEQPAEDHPAG